MATPLRRTRGALALLLALLLPLHAFAAEAPGDAKPQPAGPVANAQRAGPARFVHRIQLMDHDGKVIGPKSLAPYSPRRTCTSAKCHDYATISQGSHTVMFADPRPDPKRPPVHIWTVFDEQTRTQHPLSHGWLPAEGRPFNAKAHKTPFDLARELGAYHPGGGRYELDSAGNRYDEHLAANLALRDDGGNADYADSRWDQSGVLEIDCLACHSQDSYDHVERGTQIGNMNFKWAATVGAGFGTVEGKTASLPKSQPGDAAASPGDEPAIKVHYNPALFDGHGKVEVHVGRPLDRNCLFCHRKPARGETAWNDHWDADIHTKSGLACVDCHRATILHAIAGSRRHAEFLADEPAFQTLSCKGCHTSGRLGAPVPEHRGLPTFHFDQLACETCHSGPRVRIVPLEIEKPTNFLWGTPGGALTGSGPTVFAPVLVKDDAGQIRPVMRMLPAFYGRKVEGGFEPMPLSRVKSRMKKLAGFIEKARKLQEDLEAAAEDARSKLIEREKRSRAKVGITDEEIEQLVADDDGTGVVNTDVEIAVLLKLLTKKSSKPASHYEPLYFAGGLVYSLDNAAADPTKWTLQKEPSPLAEPLDLRLAHNVRPAAQSLGAQGCLECHDYDSRFWHSIGITRAVGADGQPEGAPLHARLGMPPLLRVLGDLGARFVQPYALWVILVVVLAMALHYVAFGAKVRPPEEVQDYVRRFGALSRLAHSTLLLSFLVLAGTGVCMISGVDLLPGPPMGTVHAVFACVFLGAMLLTCLGYKGRVPAGRFSAGQTNGTLPQVPSLREVCVAGLMVACLAVTGGMLMFEVYRHLLPLAYTVHKTCGLFMILAVLAYVYLGSVANPGTLGAPFTGKATRAGLRHHHPDYEPKGEEDQGSE